MDNSYLNISANSLDFSLMSRVVAVPEIRRINFVCGISPSHFDVFSFETSD